MTWLVLLSFLLVGGLAGYTGGRLMEGQGLGLFLDTLVGIAGTGALWSALSLVGWQGRGMVLALLAALVGGLMLVGVVNLLAHHYQSRRTAE